MHPSICNALSAATSERNATNATPTLSEIIGDQGPDSLKALLDRGVNSSPRHRTLKLSLDHQKVVRRKISGNVSDSQHHQAMDDMRDELSSIVTCFNSKWRNYLKKKCARTTAYSLLA